jgi:hypothetical protein
MKASNLPISRLGLVADCLTDWESITYEFRDRN